MAFAPSLCTLCAQPLGHFSWQPTGRRRMPSMRGRGRGSAEGGVGDAPWGPSLPPVTRATSSRDTGHGRLNRPQGDVALADPDTPYPPTTTTSTTSTGLPMASDVSALDIGRLGKAMGDVLASGPDVNVNGAWRPELDEAFPERCSSVGSMGSFPSSPRDRELLCRMGCGREVQPGLTRTMKRFDTCCKRCAQGYGGHDANCGVVFRPGTKPADDGLERRAEIESLLSDDSKLRKLIDGILAGIPDENGTDVF